MKPTRARGLVPTLWSIVLAVGACQNDPPRCVPNASVVCACIDGRHGAQRCNARGELEACVCQDADAGAPPDRADVPALDSDALDATPQVDGGAMADALDAGGALDASAGVDVFDASDAGTSPMDAGVPAPDTTTEPPVDAGAEPPRITGGFTSAAGATDPELSGSFSWSAAVYATGGGITLEGSFQ